MQVHYDRDADLSRLRTHKIAILGFGSQGHAHALNLRDSGMDVCVGLAQGQPVVGEGRQAGPAGFRNRRGRAPRRHHHDAGAGRDGLRNLRGRNRPQLTPGKYLAFGHGFNIHFKFIKPPPDINVFMIAPKGPGHLVRSEYVKGRGVPCLLAVEQDPSGDTKQDRTRLWIGDRRRTRGDYRNQLSRRNRDRSVRRAVGAVRRPDRADSQRLRNPGRSRLRARDGLFRVRARGEAHRRPDLRGRHRQHALLDQQHRRVRRHDARQARGRRRPRARR